MPSYAGQSVAVLGGEGFIGRHLIRLWPDPSSKLVSVGGFSSAPKPYPGVAHFGGRLSIQLLGSLPTKPDYIFHLAGGASVARSLENPRQDFELTVESTLEVLEYIRVLSPRTVLVFVSSAAVYGQTGSSLLSTSAELKPMSPYGSHKKIAEDLCRYYQTAYAVQCVIVRPFSVYGPGLRKQLLWDALNKADAGVNTFFGTGNEIRDWVYVEDLIRVLIRAGLTADENLQILNAGSGVGLSTRDVLTRLLTIYQPPRTPLFTGSSKSGDPTSLVAAPDNAYASCYQTSIDDGLRHYVDWYRKRER